MKMGIGTINWFRFLDSKVFLEDRCEAVLLLIVDDERRYQTYDVSMAHVDQDAVLTTGLLDS